MLPLPRRDSITAVNIIITSLPTECISAMNFRTTSLTVVNAFGLTDYFKDSFLFRLFTNLGIIGLFRSFNIKIIEWYQSIFTQEEISPKLKEKVFHQLEQQPQL